MRNINDNTTESKLRDALIKNPITRNRMVLEILNYDIEKCVKILMRKNRKNTRLYDTDDFIQEASLSIINVLNNSNLSEIDCEIRTYLIGVVKRTVWQIMREESAIKRQAQNRALPLELMSDTRNNNGIKFNKVMPDIEAQVLMDYEINNIKERLDYPAKSIFEDLMDGYSIIEISTSQGVPLQSIYTIIRRKIKPTVKRIMEIE